MTTCADFAMTSNDELWACDTSVAAATYRCLGVPYRFVD